MTVAHAPDHAFAVLAYGNSPFLEGCLASLAAQTVTSRIVIATSTPSEFIAGAALRAGVPICANPVRGTIANDWNFGLRATGARYVTLAHQDDTYAPTFLAETLAAFGDGAGALCFSGYQEIDDAGAAISSKISRVKHLIEAITLGASRSASGWRLRAFLSFGNPLPCSSVTYDLSQLGDFSFSADFASNLDWDAWWRQMTSGATFRRAPGRLVGRRHNQMTETSRLLKDGTRRREDLAMFRRAWPRPMADLIARFYQAGY
ncbi:MAG TPA: glycosyltransferase family A protein [Caulobacteraceae bacterium]|jgi:hypothetical protein